MKLNPNQLHHINIIIQHIHKMMIKFIHINIHKELHKNHMFQQKKH